MQAPCIVANEEHRFTVVEQLRDIGIAPARIVLEPSGRNTAPALSSARSRRASAADGVDPVLVVTPADHAIADAPPSPRRCARRRTRGRRRHRRPRHPARAARHRLRLHPRRGRRARRERRAVASPPSSRSPTSRPPSATSPTAATTGTAAFSCCAPASGCDALQRFRPDIAAASEPRSRTASTDAAFLRFDTAAFAAIPADSIDYAVMEPASRAGSGIEIRMVPLDAGWSDLGAWDAVWQVGAHDGDGNAVQGDALVARLAQHARPRDEPAGRRDRPRRRHRGRDRRRGAGRPPREEPGREGHRRRARRDRPQRGEHAPPGAPALGLVRQHRQPARASRSSASWSSRARASACRCTTTAPSTGSSSRAPPR